MNCIRGRLSAPERQLLHLHPEFHYSRWHPSFYWGRLSRFPGTLLELEPAFLKFRSQRACKIEKGWRKYGCGVRIFSMMALKSSFSAKELQSNFSRQEVAEMLSRVCSVVMSVWLSCARQFGTECLSMTDFNTRWLSLFRSAVAVWGTGENIDLWQLPTYTFPLYPSFLISLTCHRYLNINPDEVSRIILQGCNLCRATLILLSI